MFKRAVAQSDDDTLVLECGHRSNAVGYEWVYCPICAGPGVRRTKDLYRNNSSAIVGVLAADRDYDSNPFAEGNRKRWKTSVAQCR